MNKIILALLCGLSITQVMAADDITVVMLNDFHGQVQPNKSMVGAGKISTFIQNYKKQYPNMIVVSAGDNYQGTAISNISLGAVDNEFFDYIGVKFSAIGNHEFDYGQNAFESWNKNSQIKYLAANIIESSTGKIFTPAIPYGEYTLPNGKTIAFIGLATLETPYTTASYNVNGLNFTDPVKAANYWVDYLNSPQSKIKKPDTIALLTHIPTHQESDGRIDYEKNIQLPTSEIEYVTQNVHGISGILTGHSHMVVSGYLHNIPVVQGASQGRDISILHYDCHTSPQCVATPEVINLSDATKDLISDPQVESIISKYFEKNSATLNKIIAVAPEDLANMPESNSSNIKLTYMVSDILRKVVGADIGLTNTYGVRRSLPKGNITYGMLYEVLPFDNTIVSVKIKGQYINSLVEHSLYNHKLPIGVFAGLQISLNKNGKIKQIKVNNKPLKNNKIYSIAISSFILAGGDGFDFTKVISSSDSNITMREEVLKYWSKNGITVPKNWQNIVIEK